MLLAAWLGCVAIAGCTSEKRTPPPDKQTDGKTSQVDKDQQPKQPPDSPPMKDGAGQKPPVKPPQPPAKLDVPDEQTRQLVVQLADQDRTSREEAENALLDMGVEAIPYLQWGMRQSESEQRWAAMYFVMREFPSDDKRLAAEFITALKDKDLKMRKLAVQAALRMTPETLAGALPHLTAMVSDQQEDKLNRRQAARLIGKLEQRASGALTVLLQSARQDPDALVRAGCITSATKIWTTEQASEAVTELSKVLEDDHDNVRRAASRAMIQLGAAAVQPLIERLKSNKPQTRFIALYTLGKLGPLARPAEAAIEGCTKDEDENVRKMATGVLRLIRDSQ